MSLQVWLPLNGDLHNQGLKNINVINNGATIDNNGKIGKCYSFDGTNDYIQGNYKVTPNISFCCWVYFPTVPTGRHIIDARNTTGELGYQPIYITASTIQIGGTGSSFANVSYTWVANTWYHICITYNENCGKVYVNGSLIDTVSAAKGFGTGQDCQFTLGSRCNQGNYANVKMNDFRIYDHCLSAKEVKEIAKGLVLHYKLNEQFYEPTTNLITSISAGGQTTVSNNIVTTSGTNADTYFELKLSESIVSGTQYTIQCRADMPSGTTWTFPIGAQGNSSLSWVLHPGYNEYTFIANNISWGEKRIFMDDLSGTARTSGVQCKFYNFQLEKKDHATGFAGYGTTRGSQYDENIYVEPDGSRWIRIAHHNSPTNNGYFSKTDPWETGIYLNEHKWYCVNSAIAQVSKYEFMVKQKTTSSASEQKWRWTQNVNPLTAVYNDVKPGTVIINTSSGYTSSSFGGLWQMNASARLCIANASSGNWYGAIGCWTVYQTNQIPGYPNTNVSTGYLDLYLRIDETNLGQVYDSSGYNHNGIIVGSLSTVKDSPRYKIATQFSGNDVIKYLDFNLGNIWSASIWFKSPSSAPQGWSSLFAVNSSGGDTDLKMNMYYQQTSSTMQYSANGQYTTAVSASKDTWHNAAEVFNGTTLSCYLDGQLKTTKTITNAEFTRKNLVVGGRSSATDGSTTGNQFNGELSDFRIYATALTVEQIKELYNNSMIVNGINQIPRDLE